MRDDQPFVFRNCWTGARLIIRGEEGAARINELPSWTLETPDLTEEEEEA